MSFEMAGSTGLEPAASGVTGRRSNHLNYDPAFFKRFLISGNPRELGFVVGGVGFEPATPCV